MQVHAAHICHLMCATEGIHAPPARSVEPNHRFHTYMCAGVERIQTLFAVWGVARVSTHHVTELKVLSPVPVASSVPSTSSSSSRADAKLNGTERNARLFFANNLGNARSHTPTQERCVHHVDPARGEHVTSYCERTQNVPAYSLAKLWTGF